MYIRKEYSIFITIQFEQYIYFRTDFISSIKYLKINIQITINSSRKRYCTELSCNGILYQPITHCYFIVGRITFSIGCSAKIHCRHFCIAADNLHSWANICIQSEERTKLKMHDFAIQTRGLKWTPMHYIFQKERN